MPEVSTAVSSRVSYKKMGTGPAVVLLHGFPESHTLWRNIWDGLAASYTVIMPDFPGSGDSTLEQETSISQMADCVSLIMDNESIGKAVVAGHSMGGYVAFAFAAKYPARIAGLSLIHSIATADNEERIQTRLRSIDLIQKGGKNAFVRQMIPNLFSPIFKQEHPQIIEEQVQLALGLIESSLVNYQRAMIGRTDQTGVLDSAIFPLQWIIGIEDNIISYKKILEQCARSGINFVTFYNNCGHMSMLEAPGKLVNDLKEFINYCYLSI